MLGLNETMDQLAMASSVHWYCPVLRREDGYVLRRVLGFQVDGETKKWKLKRHERNTGLERRHGGWFEHRHALPINVDI